MVIRDLYNPDPPPTQIRPHPRQALIKRTPRPTPRQTRDDPLPIQHPAKDLEDGRENG